MHEVDRQSDPRLAELLAALSLVTDLARGRPAEEALRACLLATRMAGEIGLGSNDTGHVYFMTLLRFVGCTAPSHEYTEAIGGDQVVGRGRGDMTDPTRPAEALAFLASLSSGIPAWRRPVAFARALSRGREVAQAGILADCEVAVGMARRFDLPQAVADSLFQSFERWDGHGLPRGLAGDAISLPSRLAAIAFAAVMFHHAGGRDAAVAAVRRWSGRALDPRLAETFLRQSDQLLEMIEVEDVWAAALAAEPSPQRVVLERKLDDVARGFADFVDLKSPYLQGHSAGVAALAEAAAHACNLAEADATALRRAGLFHDLGRAGVPTGVWEKRGSLTTAEWEQVRLHAYHTERILSRSPTLAVLAQLAGMHHERLDGSGYHRGAPASLQSKAARILAAADVYQALTEERPHRAALAPEPAARVLEAQPGLDREAVAAVLEAAGQRKRRVRPAWPAGLSDREIEVLRLLARGHSERKIGEALFISSSTVHTHATHIYEKAGVTTRASVALFAMEHGLLQS
jgi:HD-GYP domain-containing protein (c-di-GMP phosphodiesterase class II)